MSFKRVIGPKITYLIAGIILLVGIIMTEKWIFSLDFDTRGRILRAQVVVIIQIVIFIGDTVVWLTLSDIFTPLQPKFHTSSTKSTLWKIVLVTYMLLAHGSYLSNVIHVGTEPTSFAMISYLCLAFHVQLNFNLIIIKSGTMLYQYVVRKTPNSKFKYCAAILTAFFITTYGFINAQGPPIIKKVSIPVKGLPQKLQGFTITQISDIHLGVTVGKSKLERVVSMINERISSDVVVIVGDLVDGPVSRLQESVDVIKNIQSKHGIFYVTGNHEYYTMDADNWLKYLKSSGVHILHNRNEMIPQGESPDNQICFAGTDDIEADRIGYDGHGFNIDSAIKGCNSHQPVVLLAHQPKAAVMALQSKHRIDLALSGHTHGGQMFPIVIGAYLFNPFYAGLYKYGESSHIYVSMGTVYWGMPVRFLTTHEITHITLHSL